MALQKVTIRRGWDPDEPVTIHKVRDVQIRDGGVLLLLRVGGNVIVRDYAMATVEADGDE